jgi:hypothetical protein
LTTFHQNLWIDPSSCSGSFCSIIFSCDPSLTHCPLQQWDRIRSPHLPTS